MDNYPDNPMISTNNIINQKINPEKKSFISKLYLDPIESLNFNTQTKSKGFRIKKDYSKENKEIQVSLPNMGMTMNNLTNMNKTQGSVIIQNWETSKNIPKDIGDMIHFPVLIDRSKFKIKEEAKKGLAFTSTSRKFNFDKEKIRKEGENLIKSIYVKDNAHNLALTMPTSYLSSQNTQNNFAFHLDEPQKIIDRNLMTFQMKKEKPKDLQIVTQPELSLSIVNKNAEMGMTMTQPIIPKINLEPKITPKLIDFSTFNKH